MPIFDTLTTGGNRCEPLAFYGWWVTNTVFDDPVVNVNVMQAERYRGMRPRLTDMPHIS